MQLSVIIVNYNVKYFLEQCLVSVINACKQIDAEILVIDNCSTDGSKVFFEGRFNEVTFIWRTANTGFSKANNIALQKAKGEIILFLNPDTILPENCLRKCYHFYTSQPRIGALGLHMIDGSGQYLRESKRGFPSPVTSMFKLIGLATIFPTSRIFARYYLGHLPENKTNKVDVLSGAFMMVSRDLLEITGGFDEAFFMYGEDIDLSYRIQKAGYQNYYYADCSIIHFKGESTKKQTAKYIRTFYGAMKLFVKKHYSKLIAVSFTIVIETAILTKLLLNAVQKRARQLNGISIQKQLSAPSLSTVIVANQTLYNELVEFLNISTSPYNINGRIAPDMDADNALGYFQQLPDLIVQLSIQHIIFCTDGKNIDSITLLMQRMTLTVGYSFHFIGSKSIVSSNDKNGRGFVIGGL